jgi:putative ABC transport system permease protein
MSRRERWRALQARVLSQTTFALRTALDAVSHNRLRAGLTSLGILFGVASVIAMLAIGKGAEQEILEQLRLLGTNNVVIVPYAEQDEGDVDKETDAKQPRKFSPGLTRDDVAAIERVIPGLDAVSSEVLVNTTITREGVRRSGRVVGVDTSYFRLLNLNFAQGAGFAASHVEFDRPVAVIGHGVRNRFFTTEEPIGRAIKVGEHWMTVVGVLADRQVVGDNADKLGIRDASMDVYVPVSSMLARVRDRSRLTLQAVEAAARAENGGVVGADEGNEETRAERTNPNQLDRIVVRVSDASQVPQVADVIRRLLARRHNGVVDYQITVPELLLKQEQRTRTIFNVVLGAIASISLIVGGIGIMNIMLASILERIREIGVRRAMGATQEDILMQFLVEAVLISVAGGVAGILTGAAISAGIEQFAGIRTLVAPLSIVVAFGVSLTVGLVFGIVPAWRAARQDPVVCLRYE